MGAASARQILSSLAGLSSGPFEQPAEQSAANPIAVNLNKRNTSTPPQRRTARATQVFLKKDRSRLKDKPNSLFSTRVFQVKCSNSNSSLPRARFQVGQFEATEADLDAHNLALVNAINDDGRIYLTQTRIDGRVAIRFQAGQFESTADDVEIAFAAITGLAATIG